MASLERRQTDQPATGWMAENWTAGAAAAGGREAADPAR